MTGFIGVGQLRYILTNLGEKMSDDEVDELLKAVDTSSGEINYVGMLYTHFVGEREERREEKLTENRSCSHDPRKLIAGWRREGIKCGSRCMTEVAGRAYSRGHFVQWGRDKGTAFYLASN